jgi:hypothetical protein
VSDITPRIGAMFRLFVRQSLDVARALYQDNDRADGAAGWPRMDR